MNKLITDFNFWPLSGLRRQQAVLNWLISLLEAGIFFMGMILLQVGANGTSTRKAGVVLIGCAILVTIVHAVYMLTTRSTRPQLIAREYQDAKQRSVENTHEIEVFIAEQHSKLEQ